MFKRKDDSHEFKPLLIEIEEQPLNPLGRSIFWIIIMAILFFAIWMYFGKVDVVVSARGKVIPVGEVKVLQPLTSGVVKKIAVAPGDYVEKGQVLMLIDPSNVEPELESMRTNLKQLALENERLEAILEGRPFSPDPFVYDLDIIGVQNDIYHSAVDLLEKQINIKNEELKKIEEQIRSVKQSREHNSYLLEVSKGKLERLTTIKDIISSDEYNEAASNVQQLESELSLADIKYDELMVGSEQILKEKEFVREDERGRLLKELAENRKNYSYLEASITKNEFISARQQISSPVDGYVINLFIHTEGGVVTPAEKLLTIVPVDTPLEIKTKIMNKDIGFIKKGMEVSLKVDTFNFQKYGLLKGTVKQVAKDSIDDEQLGLIYEVYIQPEETTFMIEGKETPISTGMSLTAEVKVGKRRIIEFFIYPLIKYMDEGISVR